MRKKNRPSFVFPMIAGKFDVWLFLTTVALVLFGLVMVYNASVVIAQRDFADKYRYLRDQAMWATIGMVLMVFVSFIEYHFWKKIALPLLVLTLVLLVAVFVPGIGVKALGASRWLNFGFFIVQPAEFTKLSLVIYLASWFSSKEKGRLLAFLLLLSLVIGLVILEPDMGTSIILGSLALILYFLSGPPVYQFFALIPILALVAGFLVKIAPYRMNRILSFLNPQNDPLGSSYHIRQTLFALGNGGLSGVGIGRSLQKYAYLPETTTDSIFAIVAEELGFIGATFLIATFLFFVIRGFLIATAAPDRFGKLLGAGLISFLAIQIVINLSAQVALLPFTGVPLPFISYGGSSLVIALISTGILLSISRSVK